MLPGSTVSVSAPRWLSVRFGAELWSTPTVVGTVSLTSEKIVVATRGRYTSCRPAWDARSSALPMVSISVLTSPGRSSESITISGQNTPTGALVAVRPSIATFTVPAGRSVISKNPFASVKTKRSSMPRM